MFKDIIVIFILYFSIKPFLSVYIISYLYWSEEIQDCLYIIKGFGLRQQNDYFNSYGWL